MGRLSLSNTATAMEEVIDNIADVISSKVVFNQEDLEEIHVLASNQRGPKQISRDIQSAIAAKFDCTLDYRKISIAQIDDQQTMLKGFRLIFKSLQYAIVGNSVEVKVLLQKDDDEIEGLSKGIGSKNNVYRLIAKATISCIHQALGAKDVLIVEDVDIITLAKQKVVVVAMSYIAHDEKLLTGSAIVQKDEYETTVKATLDAINRRITKFTI